MADNIKYIPCTVRDHAMGEEPDFFNTCGGCQDDNLTIGGLRYDGDNLLIDYKCLSCGHTGTKEIPEDLPDYEDED